MMLIELPAFRTEAVQASMQLASRRLGSLIEAMSREMLAKPTSAQAK